MDFEEAEQGKLPKRKPERNAAAESDAEAYEPSSPPLTAKAAPTNESAAPNFALMSLRELKLVAINTAVKVKKQPGAVAVVKADYVCALENRQVLMLTETVKVVRALLAHIRTGQRHISQFYVAYFECLDVLDGTKLEIQVGFCAPNVD